MRRWHRLFLLLIRRIWFRAALFSIAAVALALVAAWVAPFIPYDISASIGSKAVDNILGILASSMLAVTTFSLTAMVSAFSAATTTSTPRATALLIEDTKAQNALSTFLGAFLFAIVGICALSTGLYGDTGRVILFAGTILVIIVIVVTLLRWIQHLATFGRMDDVIERVECVAAQAVRRLAQRPHFGGRAAHEQPAGSTAIHSERIGYVTHIDIAELETLAGRAGGDIGVVTLPGTFVTPGRTLAWAPPGADASAIAECFTIERTRAFDQDPRFGLVVLSEIASRALSPAVNDPGTAIAVIDAGVRVLTLLARCDPVPPSAPRVHVPGIAVADLIEDFVRPIARDGAVHVEVGIRLQKALAAIAAALPEAAMMVNATADDAMARAGEAIDHAPDLAAIRDARALALAAPRA